MTMIFGTTHNLSRIHDANMCSSFAQAKYKFAALHGLIKYIIIVTLWFHDAKMSTTINVEK